MIHRMLIGFLIVSLPVPALAQDHSLKFDSDKDLAGWQRSGRTAIDADLGRSGGSLRIDPGGRAVLPLRDTDGAGKVSLWVYDDATAPGDPSTRRVGPHWGVRNAKGRLLAAGVLYAPYLSGAKTYAATEYDAGKKGAAFAKVTYLGGQRKKGWHNWTFDFDADKGLTISCDGKPITRFDWNKSDVAGLAGVALVGDVPAGKAQTLWVDDVEVALGGDMKAKPTPPPPPPPVVPDKDPKLAGAPAKLVESVMSKHPRLLFDPEGLERIRAFAASPAGKPFVDALKTYLPTCVPPKKHAFLTDATDGQRQGYWRMPTVAMHYLLTGDKTSLQRAIGFMEMLLKLEHWETHERDSGMSSANIMVGAALCYDWLYDELDPEFREAFRRKLLWQARAQYHGGHLRKNPGTHYWQGDPANNHRWHRNAGMTLAVLAAYTGAPDEQWILAKTHEELDYVARWLPEDGTSHEGASYSIFGNSHLVLAMAASDRCFGTEYLQLPFFENTGRFLTQSLLPDRKGLFPFGDSSGGLGSYTMFLYKTAADFGQKDVYTILDAKVRARPGDYNVVAWMPLIWYDAKLAGGTADDLPTRAVFDDLGIVYVRDGWTPRSAAAMFKCGPWGGYTLNEFRNSHNSQYINVAHDDPDANSFMLWRNGGFLAEADRYSKHKQSSNFNTILINGMGQMTPGRPEGGQWSQPGGDMTKMAYLTASKTAGDVVIVEGEASGSYLASTNRKTKVSRPALKRFRRTFLWVEGRYVLALDDIRAPQAVDVTWLLQGPKLSAVDAAKGQYRLQRENDVCDVRVVSDKPMTGEVATSTADHHGKELGWRQLQLTANAETLRVASVYDLWNRGPVSVELNAKGAGSATVVVTGPGYKDTWTWQAAPDNRTPSTVQGTRDGKAIGGITPADAVGKHKAK